MITERTFIIEEGLFEYVDYLQSSEMDATFWKI